MEKTDILNIIIIMKIKEAQMMRDRESNEWKKVKNGYLKIKNDRWMKAIGQGMWGGGEGRMIKVKFREERGRVMRWLEER